MKKIQFQMGVGGLIAVFVALVCVLIWVFVLGFWAGKKIGTQNAPALPSIVSQRQADLPPTSAMTNMENKQVSPVSPLPVEPVIAPQDQEAKPHVTANDLERLMLPGANQMEIEKQPAKVEPAAPAVKAISETSPAGVKKTPVPTKTADVKPSEPQTKKDVVTQSPPKPETKQAAPVATSQPKPDIKQPAPQVAAKPEPKQTTIAAVTTKPEPKATPVPPPPAPAQKELDKGGKFTLQVAAFKDKPQAEAELNKWKAKGFSGSYKEVDLGAKGTWFRVFIGSYNSEDEAKKAQQTVSSQHKVQTMIAKK